MEVKIDQKSIKKWSQDGKTSWDRFLVDFGGFLGPSWEGKIQPRQAKTGQDRPRQAKTKEGKGRERKGRGSERTGRGKVWKSVAGVILCWGGGVHPPLRGRPPRGSGPVGSRGVRISKCDFLAILLRFFFSLFFRCHF